MSSCDRNSKSKLIYGTWYVSELPSDFKMKFTFSESNKLYIYAALDNVETIDSMSFRINNTGKKANKNR